MRLRLPDQDPACRAGPANRLGVAGGTWDANIGEPYAASRPLGVEAVLDPERDPGKWAPFLATAECLLGLEGFGKGPLDADGVERAEPLVESLDLLGAGLDDLDR